MIGRKKKVSCSKLTKSLGNVLLKFQAASVAEWVRSQNKVVRQAKFCLRVCQVVFPGYSRFAAPTDWLVSI